MAVLQETAYEQLYRWAQSEFDTHTHTSAHSRGEKSVENQNSKAAAARNVEEQKGLIVYKVCYE